MPTWGEVQQTAARVGWGGSWGEGDVQVFLCLALFHIHDRSLPGPLPRRYQLSPNGELPRSNCKLTAPLPSVVGQMTGLVSSPDTIAVPKALWIPSHQAGVTVSQRRHPRSPLSFTPTSNPSECPVSSTSKRVPKWDTSSCSAGLPIGLLLP